MAGMLTTDAATPREVLLRAPAGPGGNILKPRAPRGLGNTICQNPRMATQAITQELRDWIVAQARAGCRPEDVLQSMRSSGWDEATAIDALETTLEQYLATHAKKEVLPAPVPVPGPDLTGNPSVVQALGRDVQILTTMTSPRLVVFGGL